MTGGWFYLRLLLVGYPWVAYRDYQDGSLTFTLINTFGIIAIAVVLGASPLAFVIGYFLVNLTMALYAGWVA